MIEGGDPGTCNADNLCALDGTACETPQMIADRATAVAGKRASHPIIVHRGSWMLAHENTLEAYRATFFLGAQGNEIDIRRTADGVLVMFHDDMLDQTLAAFGNVSDYTWEELRHVPFRRPGPFGSYTRIPTLVETLELHRRHHGLIHLDLKDLDTAQAVADLLTAMDLWNHVMHVTQQDASPIVGDGRFQPLSYRCPALEFMRGDADPARIAADIDPAPQAIYVDDPRGVAMALGRTVQAPPAEPYRWRARIDDHRALPSEYELVTVLEDDAGWDELPTGDPAREAWLAGRILMRAMAAERLGLFPELQAGTLWALAGRLSERSLHRDWRHHGLDAQVALEVLLRRDAPGAVDLARDAVWRDDPALDPLAVGGLPRTWVDWRIKGMAWLALARHDDATAAADLITDYLGLTAAVDGNACDGAMPPPADAELLGVLRYEEAAHAYVDLLATASGFTDGERTQRAASLLTHGDARVRGRAILALLGHGDADWATDALSLEAPFALPWIVTP